MNINFYILQMLVIIMIIKVALCSANQQPSYQVSLYIRLHPRAVPVHLCNGVIVESRLILTTASCVHYKFSTNNSSVVAIDPALISAVSGSSTPFSEELTTQVSDIFVAENFNYTTGENDLALLRLSNKLPLDTRNDMHWIILDDVENYDGPCFANFYIRNSLHGASNYIQSEQLPLLDPEGCEIVSNYTDLRKDDICSFYYLPIGFNVNKFETLQHYSGDRGTGFVCDNKLVGILSTILPLQNNTDSVDKPIRAYYTSLAPHLTWIFDIITAEDLKLLDEGDYISSPPYAGETNAFIQPEMTAESTSANNVYDMTTFTKTSAQHNSARLGVENHKYLSIIFISYFVVKEFKL